jgi:thiamine-monophosphate kinase
MSTEATRIQMIVELATQFAAVPLSEVAASVGLSQLDDCAVIPIGGGNDLVLGSDFVRGAGFHLFKMGLLSNFDIGYFLVAANISDLAAMGAAPTGILVVFRYTKEMTDDDFREVMSGVAAACQKFQAPLLGGDTGGYELPVLSACAVGIVPHGRAMLRSNGRAGDVLFVTNKVGTAGAALAYFTRAEPRGLEVDEKIREEMLRAWRRPAPPLVQAIHLVEKRYVSCAIDTSDGLKAACRQLAEASHLAAVLTREDIPMSAPAMMVAGLLKVDALALAVGDSVDFQLVFASAPEFADEIERDFVARQWALYRVGTLIESDRVGVFLKNGEQLEDFPGVEWDQSETLAVDRLKFQSA